MSSKRISAEAIISLRNRLSGFPSRSNERRLIMQETAALYGVSEATLYRALREYTRPKALRRSDCGQSRVLPAEEMEVYCEIIAAIKIRTSNLKGRHLSTSESIRLLEEFGIDTPNGFILAYPVACQFDEMMLICFNGFPWLSDNASRVSEGFPR